MIDTNYYKQLFFDLDQLANELNYNSDLVYFYQFADFIKWLAFKHKEIYSEDDRYYWLDDVEENLKEFAVAYLEESNTGTLYDEDEDDIPYVHALVSDMLLTLKEGEIVIEFVDRVVDNTPDISEMKEMIKNLSTELNKDTSRSQKIAREIVKQVYAPDDIKKAVSEEDKSLQSAQNKSAIRRMKRKKRAKRSQK